MPSKKYNGNSPLDGSRLDGFADAELEIARRTPLQALSTGVVQTPNGAIHVPKRRRRSRGSSSIDHPWKVTDISTTSEGGVFEPRVTIGRQTQLNVTDYSTSPPSPPRGYSDIGFDLAELGGEDAYAVVSTIGDVSFQNSADYDAGNIDFGGASVYPIAKIVFGDNSISIKQYVYTYLGLFDGCINGTSGQVIAPI
jgi:hypothetical protein